MTIRVLITGGSGFIGTNLVAYHTQLGHDVLNLDNAPPRPPEQHSSWNRVDIMDRIAVRKAFDEFEPTMLMHLAARTDLHGRSQSDYRVNLEGLDHVIEAAATSKSLERAVFASSRMVCRIDHQPGHEEDYSPPNAYGESKMVGERRVRESGLKVPWTIVRPTSIWGPWFDVPYKDFFLAVAGGRYVHIRGRAVRKSFGFVGNTVHQLHRIASAPPDQVHRQTLYLGDYPPVETRDMADRIQAEVGAPPIRTVPFALLKVAAWGGDTARRLGWREPPLTSFRLSNLITEMVYDLEPLEEVAGTLPHRLEDGIRQTVTWLRDMGEIRPGSSDDSKGRTVCGR